MPRLILSCLVVSLLPAISFAEQGQRPAAITTAPVSQVGTGAPDFLFGRPRLSVGLRALWMNPRADSDIYSFLTEQLTLETNDFRAKGVAVDLGFPVRSRLDALAGLEYNRMDANSEDREFIDADGSPIQQHTRLSQASITGSLELALLPRGRAIGQFAWITAPVTPYIGAGAGLLWYNLEQTGDFVDSLDPELPIFTAQLTSDGWTTSTHVFGGVDVKVTRRLLLSAEARYTWADAETSLDFVGFEPIDLSGLRVSGGIQFVF